MWKPQIITVTQSAIPAVQERTSSPENPSEWLAVLYSEYLDDRNVTAAFTHASCG